MSMAIVLMVLAAAAGLQQGPGEPALTNTVCPVMAGNPVDPDIHVDYQGRRVYFCCAACKAAFGKEPGKYLARLPQFASGASSDAAEPAPGQDAGGFPTARLIEPLGITTLVLLVLTAVAGLSVRRNRRVVLPIHKALAALTVLAALCHAAMVVLSD